MLNLMVNESNQNICNYKMEDLIERVSFVDKTDSGTDGGCFCKLSVLGLCGSIKPYSLS